MDSTWSDILEDSPGESRTASGGRHSFPIRSSRLLLAFALLFGLPSLPEVGGAVQAIELVNNQIYFNYVRSRHINAGDKHALAFTTGSNADGYRVTSIEVTLRYTGDNRGAFNVDIYTSDPKVLPVRSLGRFTPPTSLESGINTFTHSGVDLEANTTYILYIDITADGDGLIRQTGYAETGAAGWSISDRLLTWIPIAKRNKYNYNLDSPGFVYHGWVTSRFVLKMGLYGHLRQNQVSLFGDNTVRTQSYTQNTAIPTLTLPAATGGSGTLTYRLRAPVGEALPQGLTFDASTRQLTGTPTGSQPAKPYTYSVTDASGNFAELTFKIRIAPDHAKLGWNGSGFVTNQVYTLNRTIPVLRLPKVTGAAKEEGSEETKVTFTLTPDLPRGLSFDATENRGRISGTPMKTQSSTAYTYTAEDSSKKSVETTFSITVQEPVTTKLPTFGDARIAHQSYTQHVEIDDLTLPSATGGIHYHTRDVVSAFSYNLIGPDTDSGKLPKGLTFDPSTRTLTGTPAGNQPATTYRYRATDADGNFAELTFNVRIAVNNTSLGWNGTGVVTDQIFRVRNEIPVLRLPKVTGAAEGDVTFTLSPDLPTGLSFDTTDNRGRISGMPTEEMAATRYTYKAEDSAGNTIETTFNITVSVPKLSLILTPTTISENGGSTTVTAKLNLAAMAPTTVTISATPVDPAKASDFSLSTSKTLTIAKGATKSTGEVTITANDNTVDAADKTVTISGVASGSEVRDPADVTLTIIDDDEPPPTATISAGEAVDEGAAAEFTVVLSDAAPEGGLTLAYTVSEDGDFVSDANEGSKTVDIAAGDGRATLTVPTVDDGEDETDGIVTITINTGTGYDVGDPASASVTVRDNDDAAAVGGASGASGPAKEFTIYHDPNISTDAVTRYDEAVELLKRNQRTYLVRTVTGTEKVKQLAQLDNTVMPRFFLGDPEADGWGPSNPGVNNGGLRWLREKVKPPQPVASPPPLPTVTVAGGVGVDEGTAAVFTVTLSETAPQGGLTLAYSVSEDSDFVSDANEGSKTVDIANGDTTATLSVATEDDDSDETNGSVTVTINTGTGYVIGKPSSASVTVRDNDEVTKSEDDGANDGDDGDGEPEPTETKIYIYHDAAISTDAVDRYDEAIELLNSKNRSYVVRNVTGTDKVVELSGVSNTIMPRFFLGDPAADGWGPSQPKVNNGGLRWLRNLLASATSSVAQIAKSRPVVYPTVSIADARATEGSDAALLFAVSLDRAPSQTASVDYATVDLTAKAGTDYAATRGTLVFNVGETSKAISVVVRSDSYDHREKTLELTLFNASRLTIEDGSATGTIAQTNPAPPSWLARFGRMTTDHVVDALSSRFDDRTYDNIREVRLGGVALLAPEIHAVARHSVLQNRSSKMFGTIEVFPDIGQHTSMESDLTAYGATLNLTRDSSFRSSWGDSDSGRRLTAWGRTSSSFFSGEDHGIKVDGKGITMVAGADAAWHRWLAGMALARTSSRGAYGDHVLSGALTTLHPYARFTATERITAWATLGWGTGDLTLETDEGDSLQTPTTMRMAATGLRGVFVRRSNGTELASRMDARFTRMTSGTGVSDGADTWSAAIGDASRLRLLVEGSRPFALGTRRSVTPTLAVGMRQDSGNIETGVGIETEGSLRYVDSALGLSVELAGRRLTAHDVRNYDEWGVSASLRLDPGVSNQGLALTVSPSWGAQVIGGSEGLWSSTDARGFTLGNDMDDAGMRMAGDVSYGLNAFNGRGTMTPYIGVVKNNWSHDWHTGVRWRYEPTIEFGIEAMMRREWRMVSESPGLELRFVWWPSVGAAVLRD